MPDTEKIKGSDAEPSEESEGAEASLDETSAQVDDETPGVAEESAAEPSADGPPPPSEPNPWAEKTQRAQALWDAGNNAELRKLLVELEKAPPEEKAALDLARELRRRLRPDPVAIALWLLTLGVFCYLTYQYVLH